ncbi:UDP-4-amino-4,6-dideoxy-N-acetyl-beta-L-altrosamine transaminase [Gammaproteobacteria bacterium 50_400_T64]|nr:UDP-4-amino-4,6-dideoxy-N-acetyl-beta-L-altrosamine transaminase [Gammaproteobacteria bacterium 50_400_T64]
MKPKFLPFALPDIGEEEISEVVDSLRSGWITTGHKTKQFEHDFADFIGSDVEAVAVNSATAGLHLALEAVGVTSGDEVLTTPYTFTATAEVVRYLGADPVFVDIDLTTFNIDPNKMEAAITEKTKAIVVVHFAGLSCDMDAILEIARLHNLKVIEDAAHALPTIYNGNIVGSLSSDVSVYSFYATKTITTGEGGMIVTRNPSIAQRCRVMRLHGISRDAFDRYSSNKPAWKYEVIAPGYKYNMTDMAASIGIHQLKKAWSFQNRRQKMAERYFVELQDLPLSFPPTAPANDIHAWHLFVVRLTDESNIGRDQFIEEMASLGIGCSVHFIPLHLQPYWKNTYDLKPHDYPNALDNFNRAVSLPMYTKMSDDDQTRVIAAVKEILHYG